MWGNDRDEIFRWNFSKRERFRIKNQFGLGDTAMTPDGRLIFSPGAGTQIAIFDLEHVGKSVFLSVRTPRKYTLDNYVSAIAFH